MNIFRMLASMAMLLAIACNSSKTLEDGFKNPPKEARPMVWWHWMNGYVTKDGISKDMEWMDSVGVGGVQLFDINIGSQQSIEGRKIAFMSQEWKENLCYALDLAREKGMSFGISSTPGWSQSGGPWVKPEQAMKKLCWSETDVKGGGRVTMNLPQPPSGNGRFQNSGEGDFYRDIAVIAIRLPEKNSLPEPKITSSGKGFDLPFKAPGERIWILYEYAEPQTITAVDVAMSETGSAHRKVAYDELPVLEYSADGRSFAKITDVPKCAVGLSSISFEPVTARFFRLSMTVPEYVAEDPRTMVWKAPVRKPTGVKVSEFRLWNIPRVNHFEEKAGFATALSDPDTPEYSEAIKKSEVLDLSKEMSSSGTLSWDAPEGDWRILRFGYSLTGQRNGPAANEARGLEVDKMSAEHVRAYFEEYLNMFEKASGGRLGPEGISSMITDSWEAGCLNWTDSMPEDFKTLRAYDLTVWMPALAGYVVESSKETDDFLRDFRKTIGDLIVKNYYEQLSGILKQRGMERYSESHETGRAYNCDGMEVKRSADVPMGAIWMQSPSGTDIRESASAAHIYGQKYVAAESFSSAGNSWGFVSEDLKPVADLAMASGLNRFVIHSSVHQPDDEHLPGVTLGAFGQWFNRHDTWAWNAARPWMDYLARSSFMLQQGRNVADILWFYGEGSNITACYKNGLPDVPEGYNYDFVNADAILNALSVKDGKIVAKSGNEYSLLCIDPLVRNISPAVSEKLNKLESEGAVIVRPGESVSAAGVEPDATVSGMPSEYFRFVHRRDGRRNYYWVMNGSDASVDVEVSLNISGYEPELWRAEDGSIEKASYRFEGSRTIVPLHLEAHDAIFITFLKKTGRRSWSAPAKPEVQKVEIPSALWHVAFDGFDAPSDTVFDALSDWSQASSPAVRYYCGTATYSKKIILDESVIGSGELWLNLGNVKNIAEVFVNGHNVGIGWKAPFRFNISEYVRAGENDLVVKVTNSWANRLIGDLQPGAKKFTWTSRNLYTENSPLYPSGLLGPITVEVLY